MCHGNDPSHTHLEHLDIEWEDHKHIGNDRNHTCHDRRND